MKGNDVMMKNEKMTWKEMQQTMAGEYFVLTAETNDGQVIELKECTKEEFLSSVKNYCIENQTGLFLIRLEIDRDLRTYVFERTKEFPKQLLDVLEDVYF